MTEESSNRRLQLNSIRTRIILGFGIILGLTLIIVIINFSALQGLQTDIEASVDEAGQVQELSQYIANKFLLARQAEQAFLESWREDGFENARNTHIAKNTLNIDIARDNLASLTKLAQQSSESQFDEVSDEINELGPALDAYQNTLQDTVNRIEQRSQAGGLEVQLQETIDQLSGLASTVPNSIDLNRTIVKMDATEQAFFNTREQEHVDQTRLLTMQALELLNSTPHLDWAYSEMTRPRLINLVMARNAAFSDLVQLEQEIGINAVQFQETTDDVSSLTDRIGSEAKTVLDESRTSLEDTVVRSIVSSVIIGSIALAAGVIIAIYLGRRIINPLTELTDAAQEIGSGNLNATVVIEGQDEFATLGQVFNQMADQLRSLIGSLEQIVAERTRALAISFQVSRRLSTILDRQQLLTEVVEQVRSAFDYYHAHIYLFDTPREHLVMVGGTGEAGRSLLADRHRLEKGQGLVGKAAETGKLVLVPNVEDDPNWLANPLLPKTQSEVAVPIMLGDQVIGVLDVQHDIRNGLNKNDAELLQSIANQVAIALQNAQLYEDAHFAAEREATVNIINQKIQKAVTVEGVLQIAAQELGKALSADRTSVQLGINTKQVIERSHDEQSANGRSGQSENSSLGE